MILNPPLLPESTTLAAYINTFLPKTIRVWSILRVQGGFNPRALCDQRQYEYTLPTHVFLGPKPGTNMDLWLKKSRALKLVPAVVEGTDPAAVVAPTEEIVPTAEEIDAAAALSASDAFWASRPEESDNASDQIAKRAWRISPALLESARKFVKTYEGSHNYCNFTVGKDFRDRSNQRVMKKLEVSHLSSRIGWGLTLNAMQISEPFVVNGVEHVAIGFLGQSFMLNQIVSPSALPPRNPLTLHTAKNGWSRYSRRPIFHPALNHPRNLRSLANPHSESAGSRTAPGRTAIL